jgi:hypothetical protein
MAVVASDHPMTACHTGAFALADHRGRRLKVLPLAPTCSEYREFAAEFILRLNRLLTRTDFSDCSAGAGPSEFGKAEPISDFSIMPPTRLPARHRAEGYDASQAILGTALH